MTDYDVIIVGAGIVGAAIAHQFTLTGASRILVCEQGQAGSAGATGRSGALVRQQHTTHCDVPLAVDGLRRFRDWGRLVGGDCGFRQPGFAMIVGAELAGHLEKNIAAVNEAGGSARRLDAAELASLHPGLAVPADAAIGYEPDAGYVDPVRAAIALLAAARQRGARLAESLRVTAVTTEGSQVTGVRTGHGQISAPLVVLCAGAGSARLTRPIDNGSLIEPRRIGVAEADIGAAAERLPIGIDDIAGTYFRPVQGGKVLFGVRMDPAVRPGAESAPVPAPAAAEAAARLSAHLPVLATAPVTGGRAGVDAYTRDRQPLIGPHGPDGLYLCTGFSGGGVKTAPAVAALVAGELTGGGPAPLLAPFRPSRFARGTLIESDFPYANS